MQKQDEAIQLYLPRNEGYFLKGQYQKGPTILYPLEK